MKIFLFTLFFSSLLFSSVVKNYDWRKRNDSNVTDLGVYGRLYKIEEVSLIKEIEKKAKTVDWKKQLSAFKESEKRIMTAKGDLPLCQTTRKRTVFVINTLESPIFGSDGKEIYKKGYKYNVLKLMSEHGLIDKKPMLFFNENEVRQVAYAKLINNSTHLYITDGSLEKTADDNLNNVYIGDSLIKQFKVQCTPSIYIQKKDRFEVFEIDNNYLKTIIKKTQKGESL